MLLLEWRRWWDSLPALDAEQRLNDHTARVLGDAGWTLDREPWLARWRALVAGRGVPVAADEQTPEGFRQHMRGIARWLGQHFGGGISA